MSMDKYGVDTEDPPITKLGEKAGQLTAATCPHCGQRATGEGGVLRCPTHGTAPWERAPQRRPW